MLQNKAKDIIGFVLVMISVLVFSIGYRITQDKLYLVFDFLVVLSGIIYLILTGFIKKVDDDSAKKLFVIYKKIFQNNKDEEFKQVLMENDFETLTSWAFLSKEDLEILQKDRTKVTANFEFFMRGLKEVVKENPDITMDFLRKNG